jgi:hypothetical protein
MSGVTFNLITGQLGCNASFVTKKSYDIWKREKTEKIEKLNPLIVRGWILVSERVPVPRGGSKMVA